MWESDEETWVFKNGTNYGTIVIILRRSTFFQADIL